MLRYLAAALPLALLFLALAAFAEEQLVGGAGPFAIDALRRSALPGGVLLGGWFLEASGLTALVLMARGRSPSWWLDGVIAGGVAWIFRGPMLVLAVAGSTRLPTAPWWAMAQRTLIVYPLCCVLLAALARTLTRRPE